MPLMLIADDDGTHKHCMPRATDTTFRASHKTKTGTLRHRIQMLLTSIFNPSTRNAQDNTSHLPSDQRALHLPVLVASLSDYLSSRWF
jgi:hypothetical protein